ncbi:MAG: MOSC domain-containing protein, partial [Actinomycetota bacterium]
MTATEHRTTAELDSRLDDIRDAPRDVGRLELIVQRPAETERVVVESGELDEADGLAGDNWRARGSRHTEDGAAEPERQLTLMGARAIRAIAGDPDRWAPAGDQLYVDLDLSEANLPPGTRLRIGRAEAEVSPAPHRAASAPNRRRNLAQPRC